MILSSTWIAGRTLRAAMDSNFPGEDLLQDLLAGIRALVPLLDREPALCHGDLSPANLVLASDGGVDWIDWETAAEASEALPEWIAAKPAYLAPERARTGLLSRSSEIFALGAIAYELLAGRTLFRHDADGFAQARSFGCEGWSAASLALPGQWRASVARALHPLPELRFDSAAELALELEGALAQRHAALAALE